MPAFTFLDTDAPRDLLVGFVNYFGKVMDDLANPGRRRVALPQGLDLPALGDDLQARFFAAWEQSRARLPAVRIGIRNSSDEALDAHGLRGAELHFKLAALASISASLFGDSVRRWLRKLLEMIDTLLESILDLIGAGSALSELKKTVETLTDD